MIDTALLALPKPGHASGRVACSGARYSRLKRQKLEEQGWTCFRCPRPIYHVIDANLHHESRESFTSRSGQSHGRGIGGGKRDDRQTVVICIDCHIQEEGKKRVANETQGSSCAQEEAAG